MSKKKTQAKANQPAFITELLTKGTVTLQAASREEFETIIDQITASIRYAAGAIQKDTLSGLYKLRIDLVK